MTPAEQLRQGQCPLCGRDGFKAPLIHVSAIHGLRGRAARDVFGLTYSESCCDPAYSENRRRQWYANFDAATPRNRPQQASLATQAAWRRNLEKARATRWNVNVRCFIRELILE